MKKYSYFILRYKNGTWGKTLVNAYKIDDETFIYAPDYRKWQVYDSRTGTRILDGYRETRTQAEKDYHVLYESRVKQIRDSSSYGKEVCRVKELKINDPYERKQDYEED